MSGMCQQAISPRNESDFSALRASLRDYASALSEVTAFLNYRIVAASEDASAFRTDRFVMGMAIGN